MGLTTRKVVTKSEAGDVLSVTEESVESAQDSLEFSVNAKGEPSYSVKAYGQNAFEVGERLDALLTIAEAMVARVRAGKGGA